MRRWPWRSTPDRTMQDRRRENGGGSGMDGRSLDRVDRGARRPEGDCWANPETGRPWLSLQVFPLDGTPLGSDGSPWTAQQSHSKNGP